MAETEQQTPKKAHEGKSPAWAFKRTEAAQLKREGSVKAEYNNRDDSSRVGTITTFGDARLYQDWIFDQQGQIEEIAVTKYVRDERAMYLSLRRDDAGKFEIRQKETNGDLLTQWQDKFREHAAAKPIDAARPTPETPATT